MTMNEAITAAELNFLKVVALVFGPGHNAVRKHFDSQFPPQLLQTQLATVLKPKLERLKKKKVINGMQWSLLYPSNDTVSSEFFDVPLMVTLLRHFDTKQLPTRGLDDLPDDQDHSPEDDLARIKYYRNFVAHSKDGTLDSEEECLKILENINGAITRLGGRILQNQADRLVSGLSSQTSNVIKELTSYLTTKDKQIQCLSTVQIDMEKDLFKFQRHIYRKEQNIRQMLTDIISRQDGIKREVEERIRKLEENLEMMTNSLHLSQCPIPKGVRAQHGRQIKSWINDEEQYVTTEECSDVEDRLDENYILTVTGNAGCGKTALVRHIGLQLMTKGFQIVPVISPKEIVDYHDDDHKQVFIIDDACGVHSIETLKKSQWKDYGKIIEECLHHSESRLLITIRLGLFNDSQIKDIPLLKDQVVNLQDEHFRMTLKDRKTIFKSYFGKENKELGVRDESLILHDSFPLLCRISSKAGTFNEENGNSHEKIKTTNNITNLDILFKTPVTTIEEELTQMSVSSPLGFCVLLICVVFNGKLPKQAIFNSQNYKQLIKDCCESSGLIRSTSRKTLHDALSCLMNVFIKELNGEIVFIHDIIMDIISVYIGRNLQRVILKHACPELIRDRIRLNLSNHVQESEDFVIFLENDSVDIFFKKLHREIIEGNAWLMFEHKQITVPEFQTMFVRYLKTLGKSEIHDLFFRSTDIVPDLYASQVLKFLDKMKEFVEVKPVQMDFKLVFYATISNAFEWVLGKGLYVVLKFVEMSLHKQVCNEVIRKKEFCRFLAIIGGNIKVYKWLSDAIDQNRAILTPIYDIIYDNNDVKIDFFLACLAGQEQIAEFLLQKYLDRNYLKCEFKFTELFMIESYFVYDNTINFKTLLISVLNRILRLLTWFKKRKMQTITCNIDSFLHQYELILIGMCFTQDWKTNKIILKKIRHELIPAFRLRLQYMNDAKKLRLPKLDYDYDLGEFDFNLTVLGIATMMGIESIVKLALKYGANPNYICRSNNCSRNEENCAPIAHASMYGRLNIVKLLLQYGADINATGKPNNCTLLMLGCSYGHFDVVKFLVNSKVEIDAQNKLHNTALLYASRKGHVNIVRYLLSHNANPNIIGEKGTTALIEAIKYKHFECVQILLQHNVDVHHYDSEHMTSIMWAAKTGNLEITEVFLDNNPALDVRSSSNKTALMLASENGHSRTVSRILTWKNNQENQNVSKRSAAEQDNISSFSILPFSTFHSIIRDDNDEINQAFLISLEQEHAESMQLLLENGANVNIEYDIKIGSALCKAVLSSNLKIVNILLQYDANIDVPNSKGWTPLVIACAHGHTYIANLLVQNGAKINFETTGTVMIRYNKITIKMDIRITPLICSILCRHFKVVKMLLENKQAKIDMETSDGFTALIVACLIEETEIVNMLLERGANPNHASPQGITPLSIAEIKNNSKVRNLLLEKGAFPVVTKQNVTDNMLPLFYILVGLLLVLIILNLIIIVYATSNFGALVK